MSIQFLRKIDSLKVITEGSYLRHQIRLSTADNGCADSEPALGISSKIQDSVTSAIGEWLERSYFGSYPNSLQSLPVSIFSEEKMSSYRECVEQLSGGRWKKLAASGERIHFTKVINLLNGETSLAPSALVFHHATSKSQRELIPFSDSSGTSFHTSLSHVVQNSINEFVERQCLVACWCGHGNPTKVMLNTHDLLEITGLPEIANLSRQGRLTLFDLSLGLGRHVMLATFSSESGASGVYYSSGCSAHTSIITACKNAIIEMYASFPMIREHQRNEMSSHFDFYKQTFVAHNKPGVVEAMPLFKRALPISMNDLLDRPDFTKDMFTKQISHISKNIFLYLDIGGKYLAPKTFVSKVFSPDFYVSMNTAGALNFRNAFSEKLGDVQHDDPIAPLPFP